MIGSGNRIIGNRIAGWSGDGIQVLGDHNWVADNAVDGNMYIVTGISVSGAFNRVERNLSEGCEWGIRVVGTGNLVIQNDACGDYGAYDIDPNSNAGPIGILSSSENPWLNTVCTLSWSSAKGPDR